MRGFGFIGLLALIAGLILTLSPYSVAGLLGLVFAEQHSQPAWVDLPADARIFGNTRSVAKKPGQVSGRIDLFTRMDVAAVRAFYLHALAADGFAVRDEGIGNLTQRESEILGISGTIRAERPRDNVSMTVELAGMEGIVHKSLLVVVYWRNWVPPVVAVH